jgi:hypothetical protein
MRFEPQARYPIACPCPDADLLREMICCAAERLMELEIGGLSGAGHGEKSAERPSWSSRPR